MPSRVTPAHLDWRVPDSRAYVLPIQALRCCVPDKRNLWKLGLREHPVPWAWTAQRVLHTVQNYPRQPPYFALVGMEGESVVAMAMYEYAGARARIQAVGVSVDVHQRGVGTHLLNLVLDDIEARARARGVREVEVAAEVHRRNVPCQNLLRGDWGIRKAGSGNGRDNDPENYDIWGITLQP